MVKNLQFLQAQKGKRKIAMATGYDYPTAVLLDQTNMDVVLIGDSVGTNVLGYQSEKEVTLDDIIHHTKAVNRGIKNAYIVADLSYQTYTNPDMALTNAKKLLASGANGIKLEGYHPSIIHHLHKNHIEVWAHIGYNAQFHEKAAIQGKSFSQAKQLLTETLHLQEAGAQMVILELVPEEVARAITNKLTIPTIGIGAGRYTDGQVLVIQDLLGITSYQFRHAKKYAELNSDIKSAFENYIKEVKEGIFPTESNFTHMKEEDLSLFDEWMKNKEKVTN
ncbi:3-methyl-2-oxobutanoate hydroxymethyltransferase [Shimazuella kribbensis]|uniref:3-methyl-2-oxobutanoate hydroxymethyltransferase n=1 Tax=Shimazuella kribbensis TaxID=139808 RepID=UPI000419D6BC|nr:3-methyl-2-oxobutanoate hydroxymethyltransferase [Shimazuella kribbensis]